VILVAGATGELGGRVVRLLRERGEAVRALVRPSSSVAALEESGVEIARGDLREPEKLRAACEGVQTVVSTATAIGRLLGGEKKSIDAVDGTGTQNLIAAAEAGGVERFVYVSYAGLDRAPGAPLDQAKRAAEKRLASSRLRTVVVRPEPFHEVWLTSHSQFDWDKGTISIFGRGDTPTRYVSTEDVARLVAALAVDDDPPARVEVGGPEALTRNQAADLAERFAGRPLKRRHLPRWAVKAGMRALARPRPALASIMGLGYLVDTEPSRTTDAALRERGIEPRSSTDFLRERIAAARSGF
jgi:uncharacterized protein YbjT (DUF2867 family)